MAPRRSDTSSRDGASPDIAVPPLLIVFSTLTAGAADALIFLAARVFTANMTGNTVLLGLYTAAGDTTPALHSLLALGGYAAGVGLGVVAMGRATDPALPWLGALRATVLEAVFLAGFGAASGALASTGALTATRIMIACAAVAMGIQSAVMLRLRLPGLMTTYITGTITALIAGLVERPAAAPGGSRPDRHPGLQAMVFGTYLVAAIGAALLHAHWPAGAAIAPLLTLLAAGAVISQRGARVRNP